MISANILLKRSSEMKFWRCYEKICQKNTYYMYFTQNKLKMNSKLVFLYEKKFYIKLINYDIYYMIL